MFILSLPILLLLLLSQVHTVLSVRSGHNKTRSQVEHVIICWWKLWWQIHCSLFALLTCLKHLHRNCKNTEHRWQKTKQTTPCP